LRDCFVRTAIEPGIANQCDLFINQVLGPEVVIESGQRETDDILFAE